MKKIKIPFGLDIFFGLALLFKFFNAGFSYFCVLDDYIQYGCYPIYNTLSEVFFDIGTLSNRPLAGLFDPVVWGAFYENMAISLLIITILYFFSAKLFDECLKHCGIKITPFLYAVYLLLPMTFEGTYWISASSRIIVSLFFTALAVFALIKFIENKKALPLIAYIISSVASFGFYESCAVFSGLVQGLVILGFTIPQKKWSRLFLLIVPAFSSACLLAYYKIGAMLVGGSRVSQFSVYGMPGRIKEFVNQFAYIFTAGLYRTNFDTFIDGAKVMLSKGLLGFVLAVLILAISALCAYFSKEKCVSAKARYCVPVGILMIFFPLIPNLLVPDVWLTYRTIVVCLLGFMVAFAPLICYVFKNVHIRKTAVFIAVFVYLTASVSEVNTYKTVHETDMKITNEIAGVVDENVKCGNYPAVIVLPHDIIISQPSFYKDHVKSVYYADWAATGAIRATMKNNLVTIIPCLSPDEVDLEQAQIIYLDENYKVSEVSYEK